MRNRKTHLRKSHTAPSKRMDYILLGVIILVAAVLRLWKKSVVDPFTLGLYIAVFALNTLSGVLPVKIPAAMLVILSGAVGVLAANRKNMAAGKAGEEK